MRTPRGQTITLQKRGAVWQVPLHTWKTEEEGMHTLLLFHSLSIVAGANIHAVQCNAMQINNAHTAQMLC